MPIIFGRRVVSEALRAGRTVRRVYLGSKPGPESPLAEIERLARRAHIPVQVLERRALDRLVGPTGGRMADHQNVVAEVLDYVYAEVDDLLALAQERKEKPLLVALDQLQDPQNLGSLIRTAEACGVHGVILPRHRAVGVTPAVEKASAGAIEHLKVAEVPNLNRLADDLKKQGIWIVGLDADGDTPLEKVDATMPLCVVVGSEGKGISRLMREKCDFVVTLPMRGQVASLNAAVAGSIVLYDLFRRRLQSQELPPV
jgi:23S rRNA (guanosine2251-2'-O)-methyltransferase